MASDRNHIHSLLISLWSTQNSILQSIRSVFLAVGTVLLGFATLVDPLPGNLWLVIILVALGILLCPLWRILVRDRGLNDDYLRWQITKDEKGDEEVRPRVLTCFRNRQKTPVRKKRCKLRNLEEEPLALSATRVLLDYVLPCALLVFWISFSVSWCFQAFWELRAHETRSREYSGSQAQPPLGGAG